MAIYFKAVMLLHLLLCGVYDANADTEPTEDTSVCSSSISRLVQAATPETKLQVVTDILHSVVSDIVPSLNSTLDAEENLYNVYSNLAKHYGRKVTESGLKRFNEAVNDIAIAKFEACNGSSPLDIGNATELVKAFLHEYNTDDNADGRKLRNVYGKLLCIKSTINVPPSSIDRARRDSHDCECPPEGFESPLLLIEENGYCYFFACLENGETLESIFFAPASVFIDEQCIAFVIDTTGSMGDEIDDAKQIIVDFLRHEEELGELGCYILVPFNDVGPNDEIVHEESVGPARHTYSREASTLLNFIEGVEALTATGGGDGPEYSLYAMLVGLRYQDEDSIELMLPGSQMIVITDATSKQPELAEVVISEANDRQVCIHFFTNHFALYDGIYEQIATETGGILHTGWNTVSFAAAYETERCSHLHERKREVSFSSIPSNCKSFTVSKLAALLKVTIETTTSTTVTFSLPNATTTTVIIGTRNLALFSEYHPVSGIWSACVSVGNINITHAMTYILDATVVYLNDDTFSAAVPPACSAGKVAILSSDYNRIGSAVLQLRKNNTIIKQIPLTKECSGALVSNYIDIPLGKFSYHLVGVDTLAVPFEYNMKQEVIFQQPQLHPHNIMVSFTSTDNSVTEFDRDELMKINFTFTNSWKYDVYYNFTGTAPSGFVYIVRPTYALVQGGGHVEVEMLMRLTDASIKRGTSHTVSVSASTCASDVLLSTSKIVAIRQIPQYISDCGSCNDTCVTINYLGSSVKRCQTVGDDVMPICPSTAHPVDEVQTFFSFAGSQVLQQTPPPACAYGRLGFVLPTRYQNASKIEFRLNTFPRFVYYPLALACNSHFLPPSNYAMSFPSGRVNYLLKVDGFQHVKGITFQPADSEYELSSANSDLVEIGESQRESLTFSLTNKNSFPSNFTINGTLAFNSGLDVHTTDLPYWVVIFPQETVMTEISINAGAAAIGTKTNFALYATNGCIELYSSINITVVERGATDPAHTEPPTTESDECGGCMNGGTCVVTVRRRRVRKRCSCPSGFGGTHCQIAY